MAFRGKRSYGRGAAALAGGVALGMLGSRLLPPVLAFASSSVRTRLGEDPFDRLQRDHRLIMSTLDKMDEASEGSAMTRTSLLLKLKRTLGKHALAEEDVVYPLLNEQSGAEQASKQLYAEHADMKIHLYHLELAMRDPAAWREHVRALRDLVAKHVREEEDVEFPRLRQALNEQRRRTLSGKIGREEALVL